ncbi:MAG TPA: cytochrome C biogenesis protein, partial [Chromatiales bacterium]|nr:cytochrome C biogenesis protein [Chromatiales bacterium]
MHAGWAGLGLSFLAGFVFSFNPISFASIPVVLAYVTKAHEERRAVLLGGAFVG